MPGRLRRTVFATNGVQRSERVRLEVFTMPEPQRNNIARAEMFAAIRAQLATSAQFDGVHEELREHHQHAIDAHAVVEPTNSVLAHFLRALEAVGAQPLVVRSEADAAAVIANIIEAKGARRIAVSDSPLVQRLIGVLAPEIAILPHATNAEMFDCDLGVTTAQWGIAETGTLVLESDRERHRLASLVPPVHIAVIDAEHIRRTMGEVLDLIQKGEKGLSPAVTFITGASRTSDIELTLAIGVHGPAELHVIVIQGADS
jgi:L-lactate utilization protein LutC